MNRKEIEALFPRKARITEQIIRDADIMDADHCIGARTLKAVLPPEISPENVSWIGYTGAIESTDPADTEDPDVVITTLEGVRFPLAVEEQDVTFIAISREHQKREKLL